MQEDEIIPFTGFLRVRDGGTDGRSMNKLEDQQFSDMTTFRGATAQGRRVEKHWRRNERVGSYQRNWIIE